MSRTEETLNKIANVSYALAKDGKYPKELIDTLIFLVAENDKLNQEIKQLRTDFYRMVEDTHECHMEDMKSLRENVREDIKSITEDIKTLREDARNDVSEVYKEVDESKAELYETIEHVDDRVLDIQEQLVELKEKIESKPTKKQLNS